MLGKQELSIQENQKIQKNNFIFLYKILFVSSSIINSNLFKNSFFFIFTGNNFKNFIETFPGFFIKVCFGQKRPEW